MADLKNYEIRQAGTSEHQVVYRTTPKAVVFPDGNNLSTKLKEIKKSIPEPYDDTEIKGEVSELKTKYIAIENEVSDVKTDLSETDRSLDALWKLNKGQTYDFEQKLETGMNIAPSGAKYESLLDVRGNTEQFTTNGYQLFNSNNLLFSTPRFMSAEVDGKKIIIRAINGTYTYAYCRIPVIEGESLTLSFEEMDLSNAPNGELRIRYSDNDNVGKGYLAFIGSNKTVTGIVPSGATRADVQLYVNNTDTPANVSGIFVGVSLEKGSVAHDFEPYTGGIPSPNPDYPQEIKSVEELNFYKSNEHFIDVLEHCNIESNGKISTSPTADFYLAIIPCGENQTVKGVWGAFESYPTIGDFSIGSTRYLSSATTPKGTKYIVVRGSYSTHADYTIRGNKFILPIGTDSFTVEKKTIIPPFPMNKIGDIYDFADVDKGVWVKKILHKKLLSNFSWTISNSGYRNYYVDENNLNVDNYSNIICSHAFRGRWSNNEKGTICLGNNVTPVIGFSTLDFPTVQSIQNFLNSNDVWFATELLSPTETPISAEDLEFLRSFKNDLATTDNVITITDQNGNDVSYLMEYIIKLNEVN